MPLANDIAVPSPERVYVLDSHGLIFQMFHGVPAGMTAADGRPTNAVFGVTRAIMDLYDHGAHYLLAAFDLPGPTFRNEIDPEYKAHRPPVPPDLIVQEPMIRSVFEAMGIPILSHEGFEADDVMATIAKKAAAMGKEVYLCTSDKDCRQLLAPRVKLMNLRKNETIEGDGLLKDWGIPPSLVVDFQTLVGDSVDNVSGVAGCGPKTAAKWLTEYGSLEGVIANADKVGGPKLKESLKNAITDGTLTRCRKLVTLRDDVPLNFDWEGWKRRSWDGPKLLELFGQFGFRTFANRVRTALSADGAKKNADMLEAMGESPGPSASPKSADKATVGQPSPRPAAKSKKPSLFDQIDASDDPFANGTGMEHVPAAAAQPAEEWISDYRLIDNHESFNAFVDQLQKQTRFAIDLETTSLDPHLAEIVGIAVSWQQSEAFYLALKGPKDAATLNPATVIAALKPILENERIEKVNQNIKYDLLVFRTAGIQLKGVAGDSMIAHYLLHSGARSHGLDDLAKEYLGHENISITTLIGKGKKQISMDAVPTDKISAYACEDADVALRLTNRFESEIKPDEKLDQLYRTVELPLIDVLADVEYTGVRLDVAFLARLSLEMKSQLDDWETKIHALAGQSFNVASPLQLREILFDKMKLPIQKRTDKTNEPSTDQESLERLAALGHELPRAIIEQRQIAKLKGTYVDALPALICKATGRLHTSFNQTVASTGRLSSSDPNLQNIPARTEQGRQIRQAFIPREGWKILTADYSQVELRLLAHFCGDDNLRAAFAADLDVHAAVAAQIFKVPEANVEKWQRGVAKMVNFGVIYGISAHGLAIRLGMPRGDAQQFIDAYFTRYPSVLAYQDNLIHQARTTGYVSTILGRKRRFDAGGFRSNSTYQSRSQAEREAINMEIQGSAADLMKVAMLNVHAQLKAQRFESKMLLTVHDELVFETPPGEVDRLAAMVRKEMENALKVEVPLKVDVACGPNWLDGEDIA
ncbi:MAG: DNA polymerase I [Gemmataceae bacterium]